MNMVLAASVVYERPKDDRKKENVIPKRSCVCRRRGHVVVVVGVVVGRVLDKRDVIESKR